MTRSTSDVAVCCSTASDSRSNASRSRVSRATSACSQQRMIPDGERSLAHCHAFAPRRLPHHVERRRRRKRAYRAELRPERICRSVPMIAQDIAVYDPDVGRRKIAHSDVNAIAGPTLAAPTDCQRPSRSTRALVVSRLRNNVSALLALPSSMKLTAALKASRAPTIAASPVLPSRIWMRIVASSIQGIRAPEFAQ